MNAGLHAAIDLEDEPILHTRWRCWIVPPSSTAGPRSGWLSPQAARKARVWEPTSSPDRPRKRRRRSDGAEQRIAEAGIPNGAVKNAARAVLRRAIAPRRHRPAWPSPARPPRRSPPSRAGRRSPDRRRCIPPAPRAVAPRYPGSEWCPEHRWSGWFGPCPGTSGAFSDTRAGGAAGSPGCGLETRAPRIPPR